MWNCKHMKSLEDLALAAKKAQIPLFVRDFTLRYDNKGKMWITFIFYAEVFNTRCYYGESKHMGKTTARRAAKVWHCEDYLEFFIKEMTA